MSKRGKASFVTMDMSDMSCKNFDPDEMVQKEFSPEPVYKSLDDALNECAEGMGIEVKAPGPAVKDLALSLTTRAKNLGKAGRIPLENRRRALAAAKMEDMIGADLNLPVKTRDVMLGRSRMWRQTHLNVGDAKTRMNK